MKNLEKRLLLVAVMVLLTVMIVNNALGQPVAPGTQTPTSSNRGTAAGDASLTAEGGNVTNVDITSTGITGKWAGFYGDVTGSISLEDGSSNNFYNWSSASPSGEVYASLAQSPSWGSIACGDSTTVANQVAALNLSLGMDNFTKTFCETCGNHSAFVVGGTSFSDDECTYRTNVFNQTGTQDTNWDQILLTDGTNAVYSTIIQQDNNGFDGSTPDFQLLVPENASTSVLTTYYFFVELA
ncbi:MAG: hypothetical protein KKF65_01920 [Nanoarchaeota archaeon]|nr:hypothetical protein [Nanoarchaeota archaeon]